MLINYFGELYLNMAKEKEFPIIQLRLSFDDACLYIKHKMHLAKNAARLKGEVAKAMGLPKSVSYGKYAHELGLALIQNGQSAFVYKRLERYGLQPKNGELVEVKK